MPWDEDPGRPVRACPVRVPDHAAGRHHRQGQRDVPDLDRLRPRRAGRAAALPGPAQLGRPDLPRDPLRAAAAACRTTCTSSPSTWSARTAAGCPRWSTRRSAGTGRASRGSIRTTVFNATERRGYEQELLRRAARAEASERRVRVLQQIVADLAAAPTEAEVAEAVVRAPEPAFGATSSSIWLVDTGPRPARRGGLAPTRPPATGDDIPRGSSRAVAEVAARRPARDRLARPRPRSTSRSWPRRCAGPAATPWCCCR